MNESTVNSQVKWIYNCRCFEILCLGLSSVFNPLASVTTCRKWSDRPAVHLKPWTAGGSMSTPSGKPFEAGTRQGRPGVIWAVSKHHWFVVHIGLLLTYCKEIVTIHYWNSYKQKPVEPVRNQIIDAAQSEFKKPNGLSSFSSIYRIYIPNSKFLFVHGWRAPEHPMILSIIFFQIQLCHQICVSPSFRHKSVQKKIDRKLRKPSVMILLCQRFCRPQMDDNLQQNSRKKR